MLFLSVAAANYVYAKEPAANTKENNNSALPLFHVAEDTKENNNSALPLFHVTEDQWFELVIGSDETPDTASEIEEQKILEDMQTNKTSPLFEYLPEPLNEFRLQYRLNFP